MSVKMPFCKYSCICLFSFLFIASSYGQESNNSLPDVNVKNLQGKQVSTTEFENDGKPILLCFWATWCKPCVREFSSLNDVYEDWKEETGVKIIAISVDDSRTTNNVLPFVSAKGWEFEFYLDPNNDFKRAMNINLIPHSIILNSKKEIVWQHSSFTEGNESEILKKLKELTVSSK